MRRLAMVGGEAGAAGNGRELDEAHAWLSALPGGGVSRFESLPAVPLAAVEVLWVCGAADPSPHLIRWLQAGGRLLATGRGTLLPTGLGLERRPPAAARLGDPLPREFGLAGFGPHPLFIGLRDGAMLVPSSDAGVHSILAYQGEPPAAAAVVAVERHGFDLHPDRILAWEYAVGRGGVLCLGLHPSLLADVPAIARADAEVVLANALLGEAIPHGEREGAVAVWPPRGRRAGAADISGPLPAAPGDPWPTSSTSVLDIAPSSEWTHAGRRLLVSAHPATGRREVWSPPFRIMDDAAVVGAIPCAPGHLAAGEVAGGLALGGCRLLERWLAAADVPLVVWEIAGQVGVDLAVEWAVDLRRAWPYPEGSYGDLRFALAPDRGSLMIEAAAGPTVGFTVMGGALEADGSLDRPIVRVRCAGRTPLRIVAAAGADAEELDRAMRLLERDGVGELARARTRRSAQLHRYGTAFEAPDEQLARGFDWARERGDEALIGVPGVGRSVLAACPRGAGEGAWCFGAQACAAAASQLVAGNRDPARELLKFLAQTQHPCGGIAAHHPLGGLASMPQESSTSAFVELACRVLAWTGDVEGLRRLRGPLSHALAYLARGSEPGPGERVLSLVEQVVDGASAAASIAALRRRLPHEPTPPPLEPHAVVEAAAAALRRGPGALPGSGAAWTLLEAVAALWGLEPDAPEAALTVAPVLPAGWGGFALRRLRVGRSLLDLEVRRRPATASVRVSHLFGPRLVVTVGLRGVEVEATDIDDVPLPGARARFEAHQRHEVRFHLRA